MALPIKDSLNYPLSGVWCGAENARSARANNSGFTHATIQTSMRLKLLRDDTISKIKREATDLCVEKYDTYEKQLARSQIILRASDER